MENCNFDGKSKKVIWIVSEEKLKCYANVLSSLISEGSDFKAVCKSIKEYEQNKVNCSSENKILFMGKIKGNEKIIETFPEKFNKYDIIYRWRGSNAFLYVDEKIELLHDNTEFLKYYEELCKKINAKKPNVKNIDKKWVYLATILAAFAAWWFIAPLTISAAVIAWVASVFGVKLLPDPILDAKYKASVIEFYLNGLDVFMKDEKNDQ